jgi:hypothetical protein
MAEKLVKGRERIYFEHFWNDMAADKTRSIPEAGRRAYASAYPRPGRMRSAWAYFVSFQQAANDFARLSQTKLTKTGEARCHERLVCGPAGYRALDHGGTPTGDGRCTDALSWRGTDEGALKSTTQEGRHGYGI